MDEDKRIYEMDAEEQIAWAEAEFDKIKNGFTESELKNNVDVRDYIQTNKLAVEAFKVVKANQNTTDEYNDDMLICDTIKQLCQCKPLTAITNDEEEEWILVEKFDNGVEEWQSERCITLSKYVHPDGNITYSDTEYAMTVDLSDPSYKPYWDTNINKLMQELFPITLPYSPSMHPVAYIKSTEDAKHHNVFELVYVVVYTGNNWLHGLKVDIGKYFKGTEEISHIEYLKNITI